MNISDDHILQAELSLYKTIIAEIEKAKPGAVKRGDSVSWSSSGGTARGKITRIITNGEADIPGSSFKITGTPEDPGALIRVYQKDGDGYKPSDTIVGHKVSTLTKIDSL